MHTACIHESEGMHVKDQYVGDINDYRKYTLLRALAAGGANKIGVCWMLTPSDGSSDGQKLAYLSQPERYRQFDPVLFDILREAARAPDTRRLQTIENSGVIPGAIYCNGMLPDEISGRQQFIKRCAAELTSTDLVFFDPDNGLEVNSKPKGRRDSSKFLYFDEVADFYASRKSLLIYQHFPRIERNSFISSCAERLRSIVSGAALWVFSTPHVAFFLVIHPESPARLAVAAMEARRHLEEGFISTRFLGVMR